MTWFTFLLGVLVILDANPEGVIYKDLVPEYVDLVRTIYEGWSSISFGYYFWHALDIVSKKISDMVASLPN